MSWQHYRLVLRLLSPLHVGHRKVGNLMQTRRYVPGKVLWAALTARLVRDAGQGANGKAYRDVGEKVSEDFRFGYLWPSPDGKTPLFPWKCGDFDYLFLDSYASTALDYDRQAALEGQLREAEFIAPKTRTGEQVHLMGDLWVKDDLPDEVSRWREALHAIVLGGERRYGWGRVRLVGLGKATETIAGYRWKAQGDQILVTIPEGERLTAHARAAGEHAVTGVEGAVEPLLGWEQQSNGTYMLGTSTIVYVPAAVTHTDLCLAVGRFGVLEARTA